MIFFVVCLFCVSVSATEKENMSDEVEPLKLRARARKGKVTIARDSLLKALDVYKASPSSLAADQCRDLFVALSDKVEALDEIYDDLQEADSTNIETWIEKSSDVNQYLSACREALHTVLAVVPAVPPTVSPQVVQVGGEAD